MAKLLKIIKYPNKILSQLSKELDKEQISSLEIKTLCLDMKKTMLAKKGIGLAAPQVGRNIRIIVINVKDGPLIMINPKINKKSIIKEWGEEGCLSLPGIFGQVKRHKTISCKFINQDGKAAEIKAAGLLARVIQHEIDHLDGILFIKKARDVKKN